MFSIVAIVSQGISFSMQDNLESIYHRFHSLEEKLADPKVIADLDVYRKLSKEYRELQPIVENYLLLTDLETQLKGAQEILKDSNSDIRELAELEVVELKAKLNALEEDLKKQLIPKDPEDSKDVIFEIRSGTGGDEASIFAGDLYRMYTRFFDQMNFKYEIIDVNEGNVGGYNKIVMEVSGNEVYAVLKFESGAHRVQRVPKTESQGRVHTSAATVVVLPKMALEEVNINKADLRVDTFRSSGAGGQHVNKTESGVRFTHLPTGIVAESMDSRSQLKNRDIALQRLIQKIQTVREAEFESEVANQRRGLVGSGDRSDKIRTYNFPQNRITDHRINLTNYNLSDFMDGHIGEVIEALRVAHQAAVMSGDPNNN